MQPNGPLWFFNHYILWFHLQRTFTSCTYTSVATLYFGASCHDFIQKKKKKKKIRKSLTKNCNWSKLYSTCSSAASPLPVASLVGFKPVVCLKDWQDVCLCVCVCLTQKICVEILLNTSPSRDIKNANLKFFHSTSYADFCPHNDVVRWCKTLHGNSLRQA